MTRELAGDSIRAIEGEGNERKFVISFSSEEPYERWWGTEILDHSDGAVDLTRLNEIGCLLFNHNRDKVIGKINRAWIQDMRGMAEVEFDTDEGSELIYQKVRGGTLKGVSVGYQIDSWEEVMPNKQSADGRFTGTSRHRKEVDALRNIYRECACGSHGRCWKGTGRGNRAGSAGAALSTGMNGSFK